MATQIIHKLSLFTFIAVYLIAGIMHFIKPDIYLEVIPDWLGNKLLINYIAGSVELIVASMAVFSKTRKMAGYLTIAMLLAFIISHVYFLLNCSCAGDLCIPSWIGWSRLLIIHPILIYWAYKITKI
ncbi:MauE/DoxX family redox-associated membrane protein [Nonlabens sp. Asnod2-A12]|uniref:DoxX family protein n=1 Tax=Nonlabens sp. Asnod2-A12 TaxID=3160578 RepID=UPI00386D5F14